MGMRDTFVQTLTGAALLFISCLLPQRSFSSCCGTGCSADVQIPNGCATNWAGLEVEGDGPEAVRIR